MMALNDEHTLRQEFQIPFYSISSSFIQLSSLTIRKSLRFCSEVFGCFAMCHSEPNSDAQHFTQQRVVVPGPTTGQHGPDFEHAQISLVSQSLRISSSQ